MQANYECKQLDAERLELHESIKQATQAEEEEQQRHRLESPDDQDTLRSFHHTHFQQALIVDQAAEHERSRRLTESHFAIVTEALVRKASIRQAVLEEDAEQQRRIFENISENQKLENQRKKNVQMVIKGEEGERIRRMVEEQQGQVASDI
ncbi:hypothetical protein HK096_009532, partial [Nowakowskiella sp. JEL0078]